MQTQRKAGGLPPSYEWGFLGLLAVLCIALTFLQYAWTGQISRAESERLLSSLDESLKAMCLAFDSTLTQNCHDLTPAPDELEITGFEGVHIPLLQRWKSLNPPPLFKRIAYAIPEEKGLQLKLLQPDEERLITCDWPREWGELRGNLEAKLGPRGSPPFQDPSGRLFEFPVFRKRWPAVSSEKSPSPPPNTGSESAKERSTGGRLGELEWVIFELDLDFISKQWIPALLQQYLGQNRTNLLARVEIKTRAEPHDIIYASGNKLTASNAKFISVPFHRAGGSFGARMSDRGEYWVLQAQQNPGRLAALVSGHRVRNLTIATLLNGMLLAAGLALLRYARRSRLLARAQMQFVANVSHELRTPLTVIRGAGHNLMRGVVHDPENIKEYSKLIVQHAEQLSEMVEQVLEYGRVGNNAIAKSNETVDVTNAVTKALVATASETNLLVLDVQLAPSLPAVKGDAFALQRVFQNLITNAAKHGSRGGWIGITGVTDEDQDPPMVEVQVTDRGDGIAEQDLKAIFKPFYRGSAAHSEQIRGSGLGLSLVKEIIEAHGGTVSVETQKGRGTTFTVRLPCANGNHEISHPAGGR